MRKYIYFGLMILFGAVFLISAGLLIDYFVESKQQQGQYDELSGLVQQEQQQQQQQIPATSPDGETLPDVIEPLPPYVTVTNAKTGKPMQVLREYALIYQRNSDLVGWIKIDGTTVNYPVLQRPDEKDYYLKRDFYQKSAKHGSIYAYEQADINGPSDNVTLYGHKMADGTMFASLHNYSDVYFYNKYPYITFDTLTEHHTYKIFAVFKTSANWGQGFTYHTFVDGDEESFAEFVSQCKALSLYETYVNAKFGDKLLTLSTCDHTISNGRLVVVAKRIS